MPSGQDDELSCEEPFVLICGLWMWVLQVEEEPEEEPEEVAEEEAEEVLDEEEEETVRAQNCSTNV